MMDEANVSADEMLECLNQDIQSFKATGDMPERLSDFMRLHRHIKDLEEAQGPVPYEIPAVQRKAAGAAPLTPQDVQQQDAERSMHPGMTKLELPQPTVHQELDELAKLAGITDENDGIDGELSQDGTMMKFGEDETGPVQMYQESTSLEDIARLSGIFQEGKDYGDTDFNEPPVYDNTPDEQIQGEEVLLHGGDGEVAGQEKKMNKDGAARFSDNPLAMKENKEIIKPAAEFNYVKEMGRDLMKAYQGIKTK
jgi:hypothetical protein